MFGGRADRRRVGRSPSELATDEWLRATAALISSCMAISDRMGAWGYSTSTGWSTHPTLTGRPAVSGRSPSVTWEAVARSGSSPPDGTVRDEVVLPVRRGGCAPRPTAPTRPSSSMPTARWMVRYPSPSVGWCRSRRRPGRSPASRVPAAGPGGGVSVLVVHDGELLNGWPGPGSLRTGSCCDRGPPAVPPGALEAPTSGTARPLTVPYRTAGPWRRRSHENQPRRPLGRTAPASSSPTWPPRWTSTVGSSG